MDRIMARFSPEDCGKLEEILTVVSRESVSYTHPQQKRDIVFEAQSAVGPEGGGAHAGGIALRERVARIGAGFSGRHIGEGAGAVSYTHLDVYKRQKRSSRAAI